MDQIIFTLLFNQIPKPATVRWIFASRLQYTIQTVHTVYHSFRPISSLPIVFDFAGKDLDEKASIKTWFCL